MSKQNGQLKFAALRRVSTERQEKTGESLNTQKTDIEHDVKQLGGIITGWYGGQEHATPGHEKKEVNRLIADAAKGKFNAVIVTNADRWSRDNQKSMEGLDVFRKAGVRFFVGTHEWNLFTPEHRMFLGMSAVMGQFFAHNQTKKSLDNRISRAKRGIPTTGGKLPYGRTFDRTTEKWGIDKKKQSIIKAIAKRYLRGEGLPALAEEYDLDQANLYKTLREKSGPEWKQTFKCDSLNIHETVIVKVDPLLDAKTIAAVRERLTLNKTRQGPRTHSYLLNHFVFCQHCGYALTGQMNHSKILCYRHTHAKWAIHCPRPAGCYLHADILEENVLRHLFETFGNPKAVQRAIEAATPNKDKIKELQADRARVQKRLREKATGMDRILQYVEDGTLSKADVVARITKLKQQESVLQEQLNTLDAQLEHLPDPEAVKRVAVSAKKWAANNTSYSKMTFEDKRALVEQVFGGKSPDGRPQGVYIAWQEGDNRKWKYTIRGQLLERNKFTPRSLSRLNDIGPELFESDFVRVNDSPRSFLETRLK